MKMVHTPNSGMFHPARNRERDMQDKSNYKQLVNSGKVREPKSIFLDFN